MSLDISHQYARVFTSRQTVDKALVEEAEKLRAQFGEQVPPEEVQSYKCKEKFN